MIVDIRTKKEDSIIIGPQQYEEKSPLIEPAILRAATAFTRPETHANDVAVQVHLRALRVAQCMDGAFVILFDPDQQRIDRLIAPRLECVVDDPHAMTGLTLPSNELFIKRFAKQQIVEVNDISECQGELQLLNACLGNFNLKSLVLGGIVVRDMVTGLFVMGSSQARNQWNLDTHLTMRLMIATYAAGLERYLTRQAYYGVKVW